MNQKTAIIIGAGPAGLTAAYELLKKTGIKPIVLEMTGDIGGISKTVNYKGNRIDIGGHRFFSKSSRVTDWWQTILPLQGRPASDDLLLGRDVALSKEKDAPDPEQTDKVMLVRSRLSRIFFLRKFFDYPISLNGNTIKNLGLVRIAKIGASYAKARLSPIKEEKSLEDFFINRFGKELYLTFFKDYTEKVWGVPCGRIKPEWGAQRIKGLSVTRAILHAVRSTVAKDDSIRQSNTETSLIEQFTYPKFGPGQMWEEVARQVVEAGGELYMRHKVIAVRRSGNLITEVLAEDEAGNSVYFKGDFYFSTMPVKDLIEALGDTVPQAVQEVAGGLLYRDFITVGLLLNKLKIGNETEFKTINNIVPDNWIYIQERDVKLGRLQIFNNWSPYMVADPNTVWIGLEYFCNEGDDLWSQTDDEFAEFAIAELGKIDIIEEHDVLDRTVIRIPKTYPAYFGSYDRFGIIQDFTDSVTNLFLIGRNGMHRYNNADHSMLTAMVAVENLIDGVVSKDNIWAVNTEDDDRGGISK
ncbi:MAG: NAD(P)/FAD-dependent oxidoreductase [Actinobacteria bacterium]|nr:NAD(P)/FAD-dependent oxidoreductase [Actinomycetota bacterium]